jgi:chromosome segregation ATPase
MFKRMRLISSKYVNKINKLIFRFIQKIKQIYDLQERINLQAKDLQDAQTQRKLAVQEFTDVNEKVNELRSKNTKLSNELLNKEDELEELKTLTRLDVDRRERVVNELRQEIQILQLESKRDMEMNALQQQEVDEETTTTATILTHEEAESLRSKLIETEESNETLLAELKQLKERHAVASKELASKFEVDISEALVRKERELTLYHQTEVSKLVEENEKANALVQRLSSEKRALDEELVTFNESKKAIAKYEWQMNEILNMLNDEKAVRSHLRALATKLIEEVETLKQRTTDSSSSSSVGPNTATNGNAVTNGSLVNGNPNTALLKTVNSNSQLLNANITSNLNVSFDPFIYLITGKPSQQQNSKQKNSVNPNKKKIVLILILRYSGGNLMAF